MSVHYKFKSALDFDTITFDGLHISVADLKKAIMQQKRLGKTADFDLQITNAQTKEEYAGEGALIPKNTSLNIARIPLANQVKKQWDPHAEANAAAAARAAEVETVHVDISRMNGTEEDKIAAMMMQSTVDYDPNNYQKIRGANQTGEVPPHYRCFKCGQQGHWIKNCPMGNVPPAEGQEPMRRTTGIPRSFINDEKKAELEAKPVAKVAEKKPEIPEDLICSICKDLFNDAVMIPCCGSSFCDECVRTALLESEDNECPDCHEKGSSPGSLIPNRFLRTSVNSFRNETGYNNKPSPAPPQKPPVRVEEQSSPRYVDPPPQQQPIPQTTEGVPSPPQPISKAHPPKPINMDELDDRPPGVDSSDEKSDPRSDIESEEEHSDSHAERDDSEDDDNITVTVPPAHQQSRSAFSERLVNGTSIVRGGLRPSYDRMSRTVYNNQGGYSDPSRPSPQEEKEQPPFERDRNEEGRHHSGDRRRTSSRDEHENREREQSHSHERHEHQREMNVHSSSSRHHGGPGGDLHSHRPSSSAASSHHDSHGNNNADRYNNRPMYNDQQQRSGYDNMNYHNNGNNMPPNNNMNPYHNHPPRMNFDGNMMPGGVGPQQQFNRGGPVGYNNRFPAQNMNYGMRGGPPGGGGGGMSGGNRHPGPNPINPALSTIYQGVAAKVGTGIIDDPLEAFNRIMREKEMRHNQERRRSPNEQRRSRSIEMNRRRSPERRHASPPRRVSPERRMRGDRRRRSSSYSSSRSRSRSRSMRNRSRSPPPLRKRSRSPPMQMNMRRSRSRSPFDQSRNRGRDMRQNNNFFRGDDRQESFNNNRNRGGGGIAGRGPGGWNNRYANDQHHQQQQQQQQFYNNQQNYDGPADNYDHHQQHPHYPNRFDRDAHQMHHPQQQQQHHHQQQQHHQQPQYYNNEQQQPYMDRRSPGDQPPVPGVDDDRPMHRPQRSEPVRPMDMGVERRQRPPGSRSISPTLNESRSRDFAGGDRRRRSKTPPSSRHAAGKSDGPRDRVGRAENRERDHRGGEPDERSGKSSRQVEKKHRSVSEQKDRDRKVKEKEKEKHEPKEKKRESSESDSKKDKKDKDKGKKKKKRDSEKEKKKSKKDKKEKKVKDSSKKSGAEEPNKSSEENQSTAPEEPKVDKDQSLAEKDAAVGQVDRASDDRESTPRAEEPNNEPDQTLESSKASSPGGENPHDSVLDIYGNIDYERELEDLADTDKKLDEDRKHERGDGAELPELSKWERDDDDQSGGEAMRNRSPNQLDNPDEGELTDSEGKVTNEVLKRAENALFSRAINAIRPIEIRAISADRKKLYSGESDLPPSNVVITKNVDSPEIKQNVQITVATMRSSSTERSVEVVVSREDNHKKETKRDQDQPSKRLSVKERLGMKVGEDRNRRSSSNSSRRKSASPARKVKIMSGSDDGPSKASDPTNDRNRRRSPVRGRSPVQKSTRIDDRNRNINHSNDRREREGPGGGGRNNNERDRNAPREIPQQRDHPYPQKDQQRDHYRDNQQQRDNQTRDHQQQRDYQSRDLQRDYQRGNQQRDQRNNNQRDFQRDQHPRDTSRDLQQRDSNRDRNRQQPRPSGRSRTRSPQRGATRKEEPERRRSRDRMPPKADLRANDNSERRVERKSSKDRERKHAERKRSRTASPNRDSTKKSRRAEEQRQGPPGKDEDKKKQTIDESNFEPDYEQMDTDLLNESKAADKTVSADVDVKKLALPPVPVNKDEIAPASSSSADSSSSSTASEGEEEARKRKKKSKHSKKSKKKRATSSDSEERKKSKKSKSKKSKKKKKHKHK